MAEICEKMLSNICKVISKKFLINNLRSVISFLASIHLQQRSQHVRVAQGALLRDVCPWPRQLPKMAGGAAA